MPNDLKKLPAAFYRTKSGSEPVREWLIGELSEEERKLVGKDIALVEYGWPIGLPTCKPFGRGLFEVRTDLPGNRIARVLVCVADEHLVLLHGFIKKSRQTPRSDLELGRARQKDVQ